MEPDAAPFQVGDCSLSLAQANGPLLPDGTRGERVMTRFGIVTASVR